MHEQFIQFPQISPIIFSLGPISLRWYGVMYLIGFGFAYWLGMRRAKASNGIWSTEQVDHLIYTCKVNHLSNLLDIWLATTI